MFGPGSGRGLALVSLALAFGASLFLAVAPTEREQSVTQSVSDKGAQTEVSTDSSRTLVDVEGPSVFIPLSIPPAIVGVALIFVPTRYGRRAVISAASLLWIFSVLGSVSIGVLYLPAAAALTLAARRMRRSSLVRFAALAR